MEGFKSLALSKNQWQSKKSLTTNFLVIKLLFLFREVYKIEINFSFHAFSFLLKDFSSRWKIFKVPAF